MGFYPNPITLLLISTSIFTLVPSFTAVPFALFHGLDETCSTPNVNRVMGGLNSSGIEGHCIRIGDTKLQSWTVPFNKQVDIACRKVKSIPELKEGYNIVALSQGNLVARGVIEFCDDAPPVKKFIGLAGPHAGIAALPFCGTEIICSLFDKLLKSGIYSLIVQDNLAPTNYMRIPNDLDEYIAKCKFLPILNNEIATQRNQTYRQRFSSLEKLVLVKFENDNVLQPRETAWFGYYENGSLSNVLPYNETQLYIEDWFGLKTLDEAGKIDFVSVPGGHLDITDDILKRVVSYLQG